MVFCTTNVVPYVALLSVTVSLLVAMSMCICLSDICVSISVCQFVWCVRPSVCPSVCLSIRPSVYLSVCPSVCPSVCLFVCLFVCTCMSVSIHWYSLVYVSIYLSVCMSHRTIGTQQSYVLLLPLLPVPPLLSSLPPRWLTRRPLVRDRVWPAEEGGQDLEESREETWDLPKGRIPQIVDGEGRETWYHHYKYWQEWSLKYSRTFRYREREREREGEREGGREGGREGLLFDIFMKGVRYSTFFSVPACVVRMRRAL